MISDLQVRYILNLQRSTAKWVRVICWELRWLAFGVQAVGVFQRFAMCKFDLPRGVEEKAT